MKCVNDHVVVIDLLMSATNARQMPPPDIWPRHLPPQKTAVADTCPRT